MVVVIASLEGLVIVTTKCASFQMTLNDIMNYMWIGTLEIKSRTIVIAQSQLQASAHYYKLPFTTQPSLIREKDNFI